MRESYLAAIELLRRGRPVCGRIPALSTAASFHCSSSAPDGQDPVIYGVGLQKRDFTSVSNVVEVTLSALSSD